MLRAIPICLCLLGCAAGEWERAYDGVLPGTERDTTCVLLIRDRRTGRPIVGARVRKHLEWQLDDLGRWAPLMDEGRTDEHGLVAFDHSDDEGSCHWAIDAHGYAPTEEYGGRLQLDVELDRGLEHAGRLLDPFGEPLAGVEVETKIGCAHAPSLRTTRTNTDGVFVFQNIEAGDITFEGAGFQADYYPSTTGPRRWGIPVYQVWPGATWRGRVIGPDGTAPEFAVVHSMTSPRGPRARADAAGRFVLRGVAPQRDLTLHTTWGYKSLEAHAFRPGGPVLLRSSEYVEDKRAWVRVAVALVDAHGNKPEDPCEVFLDRIHDGWRWRTEWSPLQSEPAELWVPRGEYELSVGRPQSRYVGHGRTLNVIGPTETRLNLRTQAILDVALPELAGDPIQEVNVLLEDRHWKVDLEDEDERVYLPHDGPAWLRVDMEGVPYTFVIGDSKNGRRTASVAFPGLKRLEFPELGEGWRVSWMYEQDETIVLDEMTDSGDEPKLATYRTGARWIHAIHPQHGFAFHRVDLPRTASNPIEVTGVEILPHREPKELRVLDASGTPVKGAYVTVFDDRAPPGYDLTSKHSETKTNQAGRLRHSDLNDGVTIRIDSEDHIPSWKKLKGEAPYEVRLGGATIEVDVTGLTDPVVILNGWRVGKEEEDSAFTIRGVTNGKHRLVVGAQGRIGREYRLLLTNDEVRRLRPNLERR